MRWRAQQRNELVRLQIVLESDHVRLDHLEDGEAPVETELPRFRHNVVLSFVQQNEEPWLAWLLVVILTPSV